MGTDIHAFIEVDYGQQTEPFAGNGIVAFSDGELLLIRTTSSWPACVDGSLGSATVRSPRASRSVAGPRTSRSP